MSADIEFKLHHVAPDPLRVARLLSEVGFANADAANRRFQQLCSSDAEHERLNRILPALIRALKESASPDVSLLNFERYVQSADSRLVLFSWLSENPRAVEILVRLFVSSQFLTEIVIRQPDYLHRLTRHRRLADVKHRETLVSEAIAMAHAEEPLSARFDAVRRFQKWELLRLGACDLFGLMDVKTITLQLALLADSVTQTCLDLLAVSLDVDASGFCVVAMGKLGGEELNYSSDIDLVFVADGAAERYWPLGQQLIRTLMDTTDQGFMYRVDMRLRPWGRSGPLVCTLQDYLAYLARSGEVWEKQALLKARCIAGNEELGRELIERVRPIIDELAPDDVRHNIGEMKRTIESQLLRTNGGRGDVKNGPGGIRDVEFVVQGLQLLHGQAQPAVRSINTLDGIVRLADHGVLQADEYRSLSSGYSFLRTIEHALQLTHNKRVHTLPDDSRELGCLARRLDFLDSDEFLHHYDRHSREIRSVFDRHFGKPAPATPVRSADASRVSQTHFGNAAETYEELFDEHQRQRHRTLLEELDEKRTVRVEFRPLGDELLELTVVGYDQIGDLSAICGLLFAFGYNIVAGDVFTGGDVLPDGDGAAGGRLLHRRKFVDVFTIRPPQQVTPPAIWARFEADLEELLQQLAAGESEAVHGQLARRVARALRTTQTADAQLLPVEIGIDNEASSEHTVLHIAANDTVGFLYELTNALSLNGVSIVRMQIRSIGDRVVDVLYVTNRSGKKLEEPRTLLELRAAIVLTKHFTHLLPASPNPQQALIHFRELLEQLFSKPNWVNELARLQNSEVLHGLARLLGVSDFLWDDFLKLQHANLFPVVTDVEALQQARSRIDLTHELGSEMELCVDSQQQREVLNDFKDREMMRVDMRHILSLQRAFGLFARELTDVAEVVVEAAFELCCKELIAQHGRPRAVTGELSRMAVCALGKCGGRELGFASDIELIFIYDADGRTDGPASISCLEFYEKLVDSFRKSIKARRQGIFEIDLRLRPYGNAGPLAVSLQMFEDYYGPDGAAWPFERQALVKIRPIAGDVEFGFQVVDARDRLLYTGEPFDVTAMRAMRERQLHQLVQAGTFHAKLSPGGLVDCEYLVQGLQIRHGHADRSLREPNTRQALKALEAAGILARTDRLILRDAYRFLRRLIDAMRMVRGDARDLTVPAIDSDEFEFLAHRLGYRDNPQQLQQDLESHTSAVRALSRLLESPIVRE